MPKLKTVKSAVKRIVGVTKSGKIRVRNLSAQHLATNKSPRANHRSNHTSILSDGDAKKVKKMTPYL